MPDGPSEWYRSERAAMCYDAGRLQAVRYGVLADTPTSVWEVRLDFEFATWTLGVFPDDDTVSISRCETSAESDLSFEYAPVDSRWRSALGKSAQWVWIMENQQGYCDGLQFAFALDGTEVCRVQLIAAASSWQITGIAT